MLKTIAFFTIGILFSVSAFAVCSITRNLPTWSCAVAPNASGGISAVTDSDGLASADAIALAACAQNELVESCNSLGGGSCRCNVNQTGWQFSQDPNSQIGDEICSVSVSCTK